MKTKKLFITLLVVVISMISSTSFANTINDSISSDKIPNGTYLVEENPHIEFIITDNKLEKCIINGEKINVNSQHKILIFKGENAEGKVIDAFTKLNNDKISYMKASKVVNNNENIWFIEYNNEMFAWYN